MKSLFPFIKHEDEQEEHGSTEVRSIRAKEHHTTNPIFT